MPAEPLPRRHVHPLAWWGWAAGVAVAANNSPGVTSTAVLIVALLLVVAVGHGRSPFARAFPAYLVLAGSVVVIRIVFHVLVGIKTGSPVLLPLPRVPLPSWSGGIELLGPVSAPGLLSAFSGGLALAALLLCFGAAIALTDPQRTLRSLPASLHLLGSATVIAMTLAPQLVQSWLRVGRAQQLRGLRPRGPWSIITTSPPVLQDAVNRSLAIAASMDSRGYARTRDGRNGPVVTVMIVALLGAAIGTYALLDGTTPLWLSVVLLIGGAAAAVLGSLLASRRSRTTQYRADRWGVREWIIVGCGIAAAVLATLGRAAGSGAGSGAGSAGLLGWSSVFLVCAVLAAVPIAVVIAA